MKRSIQHFLSITLCIVMLMSTFTTSALASGIDAPLTGETGSGWSEVVPPATSDEESRPEVSEPETNEDDKLPADKPEDLPPNDSEDEKPVPPLDSGAATEQPEAVKPEVLPESPAQAEGWLQEYQKLALSWPQYDGKGRTAKAANVPTTTPLTWTGDHITFANGAYIGSPLPKIYFNGEIAFCGEWNGMSPSGNYHEIASGNDDVIKQYLANFDKSSKGKGEYIATQVLIWAHLMGTSVSSWGGSPGSSAANTIANGGNDYSHLRYQYKEFGGGTQNLITYNTDAPDPDPDPDPDEYPEDEYRIEVKTDVVTETEVRNQKTYEYSDAIGQITVRKHDQDGMSLDGALFDIDVAFSDGTHTTVNNWEVDNGARLFTWTHPKDNHDPATVTVTEVVPPRYYTGDPTPKTAVVHPTYTRVTHVETWTVTITTENTSSTVIEIASGDVVAESTSSSSAEVSSNPQVEEFADFVEGDRETTVTFVNQRITGDIEVIKKDANTGQPLAGATIHLWGDDLGEAKDIDRVEVTGPDGVAYFKDLPPGTYVIQETQPPFGYNLNDVKQTVALQSAQVIRKEVLNYRKDGLVIKKVDPDGKPIAGAVFELRRGSGEVLLSETTNENGVIFRDYLTEGLYVIEEKKAPEGYLLDENPIKEIFIYATDDNKQYTVTFVNKKKPAIEVTKIDAETPTLKLEGAVFRITDTATNNYWDIKTGADGTALLESLEIGTTYIVEELEPPAGYLSSGYRQEIVLKESRTHTLTVANSKMPALKLIKKDKVTGAPLADATFRISWNNGADYQDVTTGKDGTATITGLKDGWYSITETKAPEGYLLDSKPHQVLLEAGKTGTIELFNEAKPSLTILKLDSVTKTPLQYAKFRIEQKHTNGNTLIGEHVSDADGMVRLDNITPGRYIVAEIAAPDGYNIDTASHEVTIEFGQAYKIELTNTPKSPIYIGKVDEKGAPLAGAKFRVTTMNGTMVGTVTSGRTGFAIIPYAEPGWYVVEEVQAPDGYVLSTTPVNVEVKSGKPAQVEFVNYQKPMLQILKLDADTQKALLGAKFKVTEASGALVGEYTSDKDGLISIEGLLPGPYIISEIHSPDGYILDMTPKTVTLESGKTLQVEFTNTAKPGLQLLKLDKLTGKPIKGVMFNVVQLLSGAKKDLGTFTTGENGTFFIPDLTPGDYIITEVKAADGYIADSTPKNIHVEGGKLNTVEFYNIPFSDLRLVKIDAETRTPLEGAIFKLFDEKRMEIGTYTTTAQGEIIVQKLPSGNYFLQEVKAPAGYLLDNTVRAIELVSGKTTTVEVKNQPLGSLRIVKVDAETGKPLYGATFLLYDAKNNLLGEYTTDQNGSITFNRNLKDGKYLVKEIKAPEGYVLDQTIRTVTVKEGTTTEIKVENTPIRGKIQIIKKSSDYNDVTKLKAGALLKDAVFEIFDKANVVVDRITTDSRGVATSKDLPVGVYGIREITAPKHYILDDKPFYAEIKIAGDLVKFEVLNDSEELGVDVQKFGNYEAMPGDIIRYDFEKIGNTSTVPLDDFYWRDMLPTNAVRLNKIVTGTWSERLTYEVEYKTNKRGWRTLEDDLSTKTNNTLDCSRTALHLKSGEYITEFRFQFGTVQEGFTQVDAPYILCSVNGDLPNEYRFSNKTDVGGKRVDEWVTAKDAWVTIIYAKPRGKLPQTGW